MLKSMYIPETDSIQVINGRALFRQNFNNNTPLMGIVDTDDLLEQVHVSQFLPFAILVVFSTRRQAITQADRVPGLRPGR